MLTAVLLTLTFVGGPHGTPARVEHRAMRLSPGAHVLCHERFWVDSRAWLRYYRHRSYGRARLSCQLK